MPPFFIPENAEANRDAARHVAPNARGTARLEPRRGTPRRYKRRGMAGLESRRGTPRRYKRRNTARLESQCDTPCRYKKQAPMLCSRRWHAGALGARQDDASVRPGKCLHMARFQNGTRSCF